MPTDGFHYADVYDIQSQMSVSLPPPMKLINVRCHYEAEVNDSHYFWKKLFISTKNDMNIFSAKMNMSQCRLERLLWACDQVT